jgi:hypothetical protein
MRHLDRITQGLTWVSLSSILVFGQTAGQARLVQGTLTEPGSKPFYLQAVITERADPNERVDVEMSWLAPDKWKRTIRSEQFSQTLIVNGDNVFEQDSDQYFPLGIEVLTTAMVDPGPIIAALRPGDPVRTKDNGLSDESGRVCFVKNAKMCPRNPYGLAEFIGAPGRSVDFMDYHKFEGKRVARRLVYHLDAGDSLLARIMTLGELKADENQFSISAPTPKDDQIHSVIAPESELRDLALQSVEIIWPQVLEDNNTSGETSYYITVDRSGQVREVLPLSVAVERADDSARSQISKWKFKPVARNGVAAQAESIFDFHFDTRAYGPAVPLTDAEVRKLASNKVDPQFPNGSVSGDTCSIRIAVDADGKVIEQIASGGPHELTMPCMNAIGQWHFNPILEDGKPRPYRAEIVFRVP